jgi:hypothetical protein
MLEKNYSQLPVQEESGSVVGVISWRSMGKELLREDLVKSQLHEILERQVKDFMEDFKQIDPGDDLVQVQTNLRDHEFVLVVDNATLYIVTPYDISAIFAKVGEFIARTGEIEQHLRTQLNCPVNAVGFSTLAKRYIRQKVEQCQRRAVSKMFSGVISARNDIAHFSRLPNKTDFRKVIEVENFLGIGG